MEKRKSSVIEQLAKLALVENELIDAHQWRLIVSLLSEPISWDDFDSLRADVRTTCGVYYLKYCPRADKWRVLNFPWVLINDMTNQRIVTNGPEHLRALAKKIPELQFIIDYSTYSDDLFDIAAKHPGIKMPFCLDVVKYGKEIIEKAKEIKKDIDNKPFVTCIRSDNDMLELYQLHKYNKSTLPSATAYGNIIEEMKAKFDKGEL